MEFNDIIKKFDLPDKPEKKTTTSLKFKQDVYNYFYPKSKYMTIAEFGSWCGHFTCVFSEMFHKVYAVDYVRKECFLEQTKGLSNVEYIKQDLYGRGSKEMNLKNLDVVMIDAVHLYKHVMSDSVLAKHYSRKGSYVIYDDYGAFPEVKKAVDELREKNILIVREVVGHPKGYSYKEGHQLKDWEGVICQFL